MRRKKNDLKEDMFYINERDRLDIILKCGGDVEVIK